MAKTPKELTVLERLHDGYAAAEEVVNFVCSMNTTAPHEAAVNRSAWDRSAQGKRFQSGKDALPDEGTIQSMGYYLRTLMCDEALANYHRERDRLEEVARELAHTLESHLVPVPLRIGGDEWWLTWNKQHGHFTHMDLAEDVQQPGAFQYRLNLTIIIPQDLR